MSGGKGGSTTQTTQQTIPDYLKEPIKRNIARAEEISKIGYVPYYGPEVAAMTPMQEAAMMGTGTAAQAYGIPNAMGNQIAPEPETFAGGVRGYSSGSLYDQAVAELQERRPGQYDAIMNQFIDPFTGQPRGGAEEQAPAAMDNQSIYEALGYREVQPSMHPGSGEGVFRTEDGKIFMEPGAYRNRFGK